MKKRMNIIFFGICFLAALISEAYCIQILNGDLISTMGIGLVVLITGYLFMDTVRSYIKQKNEKLKFYVDTILREENDKWNERYTEIANIQKATYAVMKKNTKMFSEQMGDILIRLEDMESNYRRELQLMTELQKKSMEGQKNALNMQIHYNKENTKQLINALWEAENRNDFNEQLSRILGLLETNNGPLKAQLTALAVEDESVQPSKEVEIKTSDEAEVLSFDVDSTSASSDVDSTQSVEEDISIKSINITPLYDDPNKNLNADEIAALFASVGK